MTPQIVPPEPAELFRRLDNVRDQTLELGALCRRLAEELEALLEAGEVHLLVPDPEDGAGWRNPAPDRPLSEPVRRSVRHGVSEPEPGVLRLPLRLRERDLGLLVVRGLPAGEEFRARLELAAAVIDSALEHALEHEELRQRNRELGALYELDHLRDQHLPFDQMIDAAAGKILDYIEADAAAVVLTTETQRVIDVRFPSRCDCSAFETPACLGALRDLARRSFALRALTSAERLEPALGSALCMPLILDQDIIGAFLVLRRERLPFDEASRRLLTAIGSQIDTAIFEDQQRQRIKGVFGRYVSRDVVEEMLRTDRDFLRGQRRELSVLFSDLRGFTSLSERLDTDVLVSMLNEHLAAMTAAVLANRGTLDKFIGDAVMAFWGAPIDNPDHARAAVQTAIEMRAAHEQLIQRWRARGLETIHVGIGVNTGEVFVGNIGDERKSSYTVIGDHVNLAARLEGIAAGGQILITARTRELAGPEVVAESIPPVRVKGKAEPIPVFQVLGLH